MCMENFTEIKTISARTCTYLIEYHIVWTTAECVDVLEDEVVQFLVNVFKETSQEKDFIIHQLDIINKQYIDVVVSAHPKVAPSFIVKMLKGISGRKVLIEFPELKNKMKKGRLWTKNFYIETLGSKSTHSLEHYLKSES